MCPLPRPLITHTLSLQALTRCPSPGHIPRLTCMLTIPMGTLLFISDTATCTLTAHTYSCAHILTLRFSHMVTHLGTCPFVPVRTQPH